MSKSFADYGELVLIIGDFSLCNVAVEVPECFKKLFNTDKIRHILCTGNIGSNDTVDFLKSIAMNVNTVKGDKDSGFDFPEYSIIHIGDFKIGLIHGHQFVPWASDDILQQWQRKLDCDILVTGHTNCSSMTEIEGKYYINPGSVTGVPTPWGTQSSPSFMLMALQQQSAVVYLYEECDGETIVTSNTFSKIRDGVSQEVAHEADAVQC